MDIIEQYLREMAFVPIKLKKVDTLWGHDVYSSKNLRKKFLTAVAQQKYSKPIYKNIENLTEKGIIIPCYSSKNIVQLALKKIFRKSGFPFAAIYSGSHNKVFITFEPNTKYLVYARDKWLSILLLHELIHLSSANLPGFFNLHRQTFVKYFNHVINDYFDIEISSVKAEKIAKFFYDQAIADGTLSAQRKQLIGFLEKNIGVELSKNHMEDRTIKNFIGAAYLYYVNDVKYLKLYDEGKGIVNDLAASLEFAYKKIGIPFNPSNIYAQEIFYPSEIICMECMYKPKRRHFDSVKPLRA